MAAEHRSASEGTRPESPRYEIEETLGRGGMATVYLAHDRVLGRRVALKVLAEHLAEDESFRARFLREARLAARIAHPNVVRVYDTGDDGRGLSIVMEYVDGDTLDAELRRRGTLPPADVVELGIDLCAALEAAHEAGLVHRDVKPQNILRAHDGTVKLGDFGIARSYDSTALTEHGSILGTAAYLAPEQARGEAVTAAADLYALGVVLYEALTGRRPHEGGSLSELILRREREAPRPPSAIVGDVPPGLDTTLLRCLALRPGDRPASASALADELAGTLSEVPTRPLPPAAVGDAPTAVTAPAVPRAIPRRAVVLGSLALTGLAAVVAAVTFGGSAADPAGSADAGSPGVRRATPPVTQPPSAPAPQPARAATCDEVGPRRDRLEQQKRALNEQKEATEDAALLDLLDAQLRTLDEQTTALDLQASACDDGEDANDDEDGDDGDGDD